jgi:hypothetical protein
VAIKRLGDRLRFTTRQARQPDTIDAAWCAWLKVRPEAGHQEHETVEFAYHLSLDANSPQRG